jgi:membrane-bound lytic murein transglycosylase B
MERAGVRLAVRPDAWRAGAAGAVGTLALLRISSRLIEQHREGVWAERLARRLELDHAKSLPLRTQTSARCEGQPATRTASAGRTAQNSRNRRQTHAGPPKGTGRAAGSARSWSVELAAIAADAHRRHELSARRRARAARRPTQRSGRRRARHAAIALTLMMALAIGLASMGTSPTSSAQGDARAFPRSASPYARRDIPGAYVKLYLQAASKYHLDWATLAAVGQIESDHGRSRFPGVRSGTNRAGAAGPTQFLAATWARYGVDANNDGSISPYDPADAIAAMAAYLRASGAPENWPRALFAYNHSDAYVVAVLRLSRRYEKRRLA